MTLPGWFLRNQFMGMGTRKTGVSWLWQCMLFGIITSTLSRCQGWAAVSAQCALLVPWAQGPAPSVSAAHQGSVPSCFLGLYATASAQDSPVAQGCAHRLLCLAVPWVCLSLTGRRCRCRASVVAETGGGVLAQCCWIRKPGGQAWQRAPSASPLYSISM